MADHYYIFNAEADMLAVLESLGAVSPEGDVLPYHNGAALDVVGRIVDTPAVIDPETMEVTQEATFVDGWHLNVRGEIEGLEAYEIEAPTTPARRWA